MNNTLLANDIAGVMALTMLMPFLMFGFLIISQAFWFCMLLEVATSKRLVGTDKLVWVLVVVFTNWIGAIIYFIAGRPKPEHKVKRPLPVPRNIYIKKDAVKNYVPPPIDL